MADSEQNETTEPTESPEAADSAEPAEAAQAPDAAEPAASGEATEEKAEKAEKAEEAEQPEQPEQPQHTYEELKHKTVAQLREIATGLGDHEELHGYTTMHKEHLIEALCKVLGIEAHEHHEVVGINKRKVKAKIRDLKKQRDAAEQAKDSKQLRVVRRRIRSLKRKIRKATV